MRRVVLVGVGVLVTLAGVIFTLQGVGVLGGSVMSGVTFWAVAGPVIALAGLAIAAIGLRGGLASQARRLCLTCDWYADTAISSPPGPRGTAGTRFVALDGDFAQVSSGPGGTPPPNSPRQGVTVSSPVPYLSPAQLQAALSVRDLSDPGEGPHAIQVLIDRAVEALSRAWSCEVRWCRGAKVVPVADNYDRLGYAADAITREARCTRYVSAGQMLRSHSSAMVPPALRELARDPGDDVLLVCPGMAYRRDVIDWQTSSTSSPGSWASSPSAGGTMALEWLRSICPVLT